MVAIINYGLGNLASIQNMFKKIGIKSIITNDPNEIKAADRLLLPGVGHFAKGMENLNKSGLIPVIEDCIFQNKKPILGICLGMQLMTNRSEEGDCEGLGWIDAQTIKFKFDDNNLKIPHMGWSEVIYQNQLINSQLENSPRYYFVHSYHVVCNSNENVLATCDYGKEFTCGIQRDNIWGVQFHPEKSHSHGKKLLTIFVNS
jgi:glutamine amidotransferase